MTGKPGWWEVLVGPGKTIDTDRFFVICSNVLGGCMGTTGPASTNPATGKPYGLDLPVITIRDMVRAQAMLVDHLGIDTLFSRARRLDGRHAGAAMGVELSRARLLGAADRHRRAPLLAEHRLPRGRPAGGDGRSRTGAAANISRPACGPRKGLAVARMAAHITYLSEAALHRKFGRNLQDRDALTFGFDADFQIESYLRHQGMTFVDRFDANSYLYMTRAMDYFDLAADYGGRLAERLPGHEDALLRRLLHQRLAVSDRREPRDRACAERRRRNVSFVEIETDRGHDAFLLDEPELFAAIGGFLRSAARARGLG